MSVSLDEYGLPDTRRGVARTGSAKGGAMRGRGRPSRNEASAIDELLLERTLVRLRMVGFAGLSLDEVAADAGVTKTTIYRRFSSKSALLEAVAARELARLKRAAEPSGVAGDTPLASLRAAAKHYFELMGSDEVIDFLIYLMFEGRKDSELKTMNVQWSHAAIAPMQAAIIASQRAGLLRPGAPDAATLILADLLGGAAHRRRLGWDWDDILGGMTMDEWFDARWQAFLTIFSPPSP